MMEKIIVVAQDGSGDFSTIQEAINCVQEKTLIQVKAGVYKEVVTISSDQPAIHLKGEGAEQTKITFNHYAGLLNEKGEKLGTTQSATVFIDAHEFIAEALTFENSYYRPGLDSPGRQAVAVNTTGQQNQFINCAFKGFQDTLYVRDGSCTFLNCYIEGDIDFIFGGAQAIFKNCEIHSLYGGSQEDNGYITAASTSASQKLGFLFENCRLTASKEMPAGTVYLGRPWHPSSKKEPVCSSTIFKNCELGPHIKAEGWTFMGTVQPETERLYEYQNTGAGAQINSARRQLTKAEVFSVL